MQYFHIECKIVSPQKQRWWKLTTKKTEDANKKVRRNWRSSVLHQNHKKFKINETNERLSHMRVHQSLKVLHSQLAFYDWKIVEQTHLELFSCWLCYCIASAVYAGTASIDRLAAFVCNRWRRRRHHHQCNSLKTGNRIQHEMAKTRTK